MTGIGWIADISGASNFPTRRYRWIMPNQTKKRARRRTKALPPTPAFKRINSLKKVPDLTAAITAATLLEGALERALTKRMARMTAAEHNQLFHSGPLRNFQPKVDMGRALALFGAETEADFRAVAQVRNEFAHSFSDVEFTTPKISKICFEMKRPEKRAVDLFSGTWGEEDRILTDTEVLSSPKFRYLKTVSMLLLLLEGSTLQRPKRDRATWPRFNS
ncbi:hypothetical protein RZN05_18145 [Sphingomonas sp. HF-S4]|uniref:Mannitol repressor n=1 Tax=Sphingomonas agrestis TaxID=3080540 RepID=A0ABU3YC11_9SPHN|nr:hypothetical protein [Sphingomonas sp. HF-S4]MDV3458925.1 hypothetical protein [Sphingomonas sp. HF-S4]